MKKSCILSVALLLMLVACGGESGSSEKDSSGKNSVRTDSADSSMKSDQPLSGVWDESNEQDMPQKSKAELKALTEYWARATAAEKAWFRSARVDAFWKEAQKRTPEVDVVGPSSPGLYDDQINQLTALEAIYYYVHFPGQFYQNCDPALPTSAHYNIISPNIYVEASEWGPSDRQRELIQKHRKEVIALMMQWLKKQDAVSPELILFIAETNLIDSAPELLRIFHNAKVKDHLLLSVLLRFMNYEEYGPLKSSPYYSWLFEKSRSGIASSDENVEMIVTWANDWLISRKLREVN